MREILNSNVLCHFLWFRLLFTILFVAIYGCVPFSTIYWEPSALGGRLLNRMEGTIGFNDMIEFSFKDVKVRFSSGGSWLVIELLIPEKEIASFMTDEVELHENCSSSRKFKFTLIDWDKKTLKQFYVKPTDVMHGESRNYLIGESRPKTYGGFLKLGDLPMTNYAIQPPLLKVGDQIYKMPLIKFTRKEGIGIGSIN